MSAPRTRVGDLGDTPWWANAPASLAAVTATACAVLGERVSPRALAWQIVVGCMSFAVAMSRRARPGDARPAADRRAQPQGSHGTGWWLLLHAVMVASGAAPFMWLALGSKAGSDGMSLVGVTAAAVGLLFGTRSGLTISIACSAGTLALALASPAGPIGSSGLLGLQGWWFGSGIPVWLPALSVICVLLACASVARLGLAELATAPNIPAPFSAPVTDRRGEGLFRTPSRRGFTASLVVTALCVGLAALLEPLVSPTTQRLSNATADRLTQATGGALGDSGLGAASSVFRGARGSGGSSRILGASDSFAIDDFGATSDEEVLRVTVTRGSNRFADGASFATGQLLKGQSFDTWDGRRWFSTAEVVRSLEPFEATFSATADPARSADLLVSHVELRRGSTNLVFGPSRIAQVDLASQRLLLKDDESVVTNREMGEGSKYSVISARHPQRDDGPEVLISTIAESQDEMRAYGVRAEHFDTSTMTDRSRTLAESFAAGQTSVQGVIAGVESWLATNTVYDYTARQDPKAGADVVDDFLFDSKAGWCEQFATATVMLLRANGIPARLATGYLPSTMRADGSFSVLGRDAHAWVEYYVPGFGWAERDPTRVVPIAKLPPEPAAGSQSGGGLRRLLLTLVVAAVLLGAMSLLLQRTKQSRRPASPIELSIRNLERFGEDHDYRRAPGQTLTEFAGALDDRIGAEREPNIRSVVALLEQERFDTSADGTSLNQADHVMRAVRTAFPAHDEGHRKLRPSKRESGHRQT